MKPIPKDDNGFPLFDRGTELFTYRIAELGVTFTPVTLPVDCKEILLHVESGQEVLRIQGTVAGSVPARLTAGGTSITLPLTVAAGQSLAELAVPSGVAALSILAWR